MNPEQWLSLKWNGGSTMSDRWLNQSKIIHYVKNNFSHATGSIAGMVSYDAGIQRMTSTDPSG